MWPLERGEHFIMETVEKGRSKRRFQSEKVGRFKYNEQLLGRACRHLKTSPFNEEKRACRHFLRRREQRRARFRAAGVRDTSIS